MPVRLYTPSGSANQLRLADGEDNVTRRSAFFALFVLFALPPIVQAEADLYAALGRAEEIRAYLDRARPRVEKLLAPTAAALQKEHEQRALQAEAALRTRHAADGSPRREFESREDYEARLAAYELNKDQFEQAWASAQEGLSADADAALRQARLAVERSLGLDKLRDELADIEDATYFVPANIEVGRYDTDRLRFPVIVTHDLLGHPIDAVLSIPIDVAREAKPHLTTAWAAYTIDGGQSVLESLWAIYEGSWQLVRTEWRRDQRLRGHPGAVYTVAFTADGSRVITGGVDGRGRIWDTATGDEVHVLEGHTSLVSSVAVGDQTVITGSADGSIRTWDLDTGAEGLAIDAHRSAITSVAITPNDTRALTGSQDGTGKLWNLDTRAELALFSGHNGPVTSVAIHPDGRAVITASLDTTARLWDMETGEEIRAFQGQGRPINAVAISADGTRLVTGSDGSAATLWDLASGAKIAEYRGTNGSMNSVAFSPDGRSMLAGEWGDTATLWDIGSGEMARTYVGHAGSVLTVAISPDGSRAATGSWDGSARLWDLQTSELTHSLIGHTSAVPCVAITPDGGGLVTGSDDGTAKLWDLGSGAEAVSFVGHSQPVSSLAISPDGQQLITGSLDRTAKLWDLDTGQEIRSYFGHAAEVLAVAVSSDASTIVTGSRDTTALAWDLQEGLQVGAFIGHAGPVKALAFTSDGRALVTGSQDGTVRLWDQQTGQELQSFAGSGATVWAVAVSADQKWVVSGAGDGVATLWSVDAGNEVRSFTGHEGPVYAVSITADGRGLMTGSEDGTARLWDMSTGSTRRTFGGYTSAVRAVAVSPDGDTLVVSTAQGVVETWRLHVEEPAPVPKGLPQDLPEGSPEPPPPRHYGDVQMVTEPTFSEPSDDTMLDAEETGVISFTLANRGLGEAEDVAVTLVLLGDTAGLSYDRSRRFGSLPPGAEQLVRIPITAGFDVQTDLAVFRIAVSETWGWQPKPRQITVRTRAFHAPALVVDDENIGIDDGGIAGTYGNDNGIIEPGEGVVIGVVVQNTGMGMARDVTAHVSLDGEGEGIYKGSKVDFDLGEVEAGDYRHVAFTVQINRLYARSAVTATLSLREATAQFGAEVPISLPLGIPTRRRADVRVEREPRPVVDVTWIPPDVLVSEADRIPENAIPGYEDAVAVVIGIEEYLRAPSATYARRDAKVFYQYARSVLGVQDDRINLVVDNLASKAEFDKIFDPMNGWVKKRILAGGATDVFLFYSGHGAPTADGSTFLLPYDIDPNYIEATGAGLRSICAALAGMGARHVTVFIDACFSGTARAPGRGEGEILARNTRPIVGGMEPTDAYAGLACFTAMAASAESETSSGYDIAQHGLFTYYLLLGLQGAADDAPRDGSVTTQELAGYVSMHVTNTALKDLDRQQTPTLRTERPLRVLAAYEQ